MRSTQKFVRAEVVANQVETTRKLAGDKKGMAAIVALAIGISDCLDYAITNGDGWVSIGRTQSKEAVIVTLRFGSTPVSFSGATLAECLNKMLDEYRDDV